MIGFDNWKLFKFIPKFLEQRVYGVSHKKFSADEETRQRQLQVFFLLFKTMFKILIFKELLDMTKKTDATRRKEMEEARKKQLAKHEKLNKLRIKNGLERGFFESIIYV